MQLCPLACSGGSCRQFRSVWEQSPVTACSPESCWGKASPRHRSALEALSCQSCGAAKPSAWVPRFHIGPIPGEHFCMCLQGPVSLPLCAACVHCPQAQRRFVLPARVSPVLPWQQARPVKRRWPAPELGGLTQCRKGRIQNLCTLSCSDDSDSYGPQATLREVLTCYVLYTGVCAHTCIHLHLSFFLTLSHTFSHSQPSTCSPVSVHSLPHRPTIPEKLVACFRHWAPANGWITPLLWFWVNFSLKWSRTLSTWALQSPEQW